ncbi:ceramide glucosyltransferase [Rhizobium leucaenae]|uniref:ceramide glucosyltransferase n=1 Tax=Rhizobium leucaenae TaxID=29450 RepID=UPI0007EE5EF8|nr:ceramide glucosyltransferase [Rhizobium leucaenae]MBB6303725.1 ceramide glucosyltransferase [Rhizobium leucaenae]
MSYAAALSLIVLCFLALVQLTSIALATLRLLRPSQESFAQEGVTILKPISGLENNIEKTLRSSFHVNYPRYELIFCAASSEDPAVPLVKYLLSANPGISARLLIGDEKISQNPKLNNLFKGWKACAYDLVVISDSNVLIPPDYIRRLLACRSETTFVVCSPPVAVDAKGLAASVEAAFLNTYQARWQMAADLLGVGFVQGKTMMLSRQELEPYGGLAGLASEIAEDAAATKIARRSGSQVRIVDEPFFQPLGRRSFRDVWQRQVRWAELRRRSFPLAYFGEILTGSGLPTGLYLALVQSGMAPLIGLPIMIAIWYALEILLAAAFRWPLNPTLVASFFLRDFLIPVVWLAGWLAQGFVWRGNKIDTRKFASDRPLPLEN